MNKENYNIVLEMLATLSGYNILKKRNIISWELSEKMDRLRDDIFFTYGEEIYTLLELLTSSGLFEIFYGDEDDNSYVLIDTKAINFTKNKIQIEAGYINSGTLTLPADIENWYSDKYAFIPVD